jgi:hypothetical protein
MSLVSNRVAFQAMKTYKKQMSDLTSKENGFSVTYKKSQNGKARNHVDLNFSVRKSGCVDRKKDRNWTGPD